MKLVRGGTFLMGSEDFYVEERPVRPVSVGDFWIDEVPVTNQAFATFVEATGYRTVAEQFLSSSDFPGYTPEMLVPGSSVFQPPGDVATMQFADGEIPAWWHFVPGASWR